MSLDFGMDLGKGRLNFNTGYFAKQAHGSVMVSLGETIVFASAVMSEEAKEGQDFFPLTVDYREKVYAAGKIPGGFIKRENRASDREILVARLTDRPMRPLFPSDFVNEVQIIIYVMSADKENQQDILAINAASAALMLSGMPFKGPVGAVRVGRVDGQFIINPTFQESKKSDMDVVVAGTTKAVTMIEGCASLVSEDDMIGAVEFAHRHIVQICELQQKMASEAAKPQMTYTPVSFDQNLKNELKKRYHADLEKLNGDYIKKNREKNFSLLVKRAKEELKEQFPDTIGQTGMHLDELDGEIIRRRILEEGKRADGRGLKDIRPIDIMVGILPRTHGSAVFTRGETQSVGITTLGTVADAQRMDNLEGETEKRFMLHYHFPPFCVGETGRTGGAGRREIGHGMLAERALEAVVPDMDVFPYTIRQVSEIFESNGSSSMASVCSGTLSMFNAGVPLKAPVAGIAMGLVMEGDSWAVISDILGLEDHLGDMDFKVTGSKDGISAFQLDIKIEGINTDIMRKALEQAREGRLHILEKMNAVISEPEKEMSPYAPKIKTIIVNPEKIGEIIGPGGKTIKRIVEETGANINIEDDGSVAISAPNSESIENAIAFIARICEEIEIGRVYEGTVKRITDFGAFVEILPRKEGLVHISNLAPERVRSVGDVVKLGDRVKVRVIKIDKQGRIDLSRKDALDE